MSEPRPAPKPEPVADSDKLPWLEPYRERAANVMAPLPTTAVPAKRRRRGGGTALFGIVGALALGGAGYWFGRETAPQEVITPQTTVIAPLPPSPIPVQRDGDLAYRSLDDDVVEPVVSEGSLAPPPAPEPVAERSAPRRETVARVVRDTPPPPPPAPPPPRPRTMEPLVAPPVVATPAPPVATPAATAAPLPVPVVVHRNVTPTAAVSANQTIELGAFISRRTANAAYKRVVRRYPYLGTRPKTVTAYPRSAGWPPVYRLRLGTGSARNARTLCRYVRSIGQRCAVV